MWELLQVCNMCNNDWLSELGLASFVSNNSFSFYLYRLVIPNEVKNIFVDFLCETFRH